MSWQFRDRTLIDPASNRTAPVSVASPVRRGHVPSWLKKRLRPHKLDLTCYTPAHPLLGGADWLDHWGSTLEGNGDVESFVSEPYQLTAEGMRGLMHFATTLGLYVIVRSSSAYYPTYSLRITLLPPTGGQ